MDYKKDMVGKSLNEIVETLKARNQEYRIFQEGVEAIITADFHFQRLNITVNKDNVITHVEIG